MFLLVPIFGVGVFVWGATVGITLPDDISESGHNIDHLFYFILWLTGVVFVATEVALFWFLWKYDADANPRAGQVHARQPHAGSRLDDSAGRHAAVHRHLSDERLGRRRRCASRQRSPTACRSDVVELEVTARQFEWRLRYPGARTASSARPDDLFTRERPAHSGRRRDSRRS